MLNISLKRIVVQTDYFESSTISIILAWIFSIPVFICLVIWAAQMLFKKLEDLLRVFNIWLFICIIFLSPFRYLILQILLATCFAVQSLRAFPPLSFSHFTFLLFLVFYMQLDLVCLCLLIFGLRV